MRTLLLILLLGTCARAPLFAQPDAPAPTVEELSLTAYLSNDGDDWAKATAAAAELPATPADQLRAAKAYFGAATNALVKKDDRLDDYLDGLETALNAVLEADDRHPTATGLYSGYLGLLIAQTPIKGMMYGRKSAKYAANGVKYDATDALAHYFRASNLYYTPENWGGDPAAAVRHLQKAVKLFPAGTDGSDWLYLQTHALLGQALTKTGDRAAARATYELALQLRPDFGYVRNVLLPQLDKNGK